MWEVVADSTSSYLKLHNFNIRNLEKPISSLESFAKSESPFSLSTLKALSFYNGLALS